MTFIRLILAPALAVFLLVCGGCSPAPQAPTAPVVRSEPTTEDEAPSARPNLLLIVADALRADRVTGTREGVVLMPRINEFAGESWNFRRARAQATWTKPSMATVFTSLYPEVHNVLFGIHDPLPGLSPMADKLPEELETMAEFLKGHGYSTGAIQTNANITVHFGFEQGFDSYPDRKYPEFRANDVTDYTIEALEKLSPPFFFYAHYMDTHAPYDPPAQYLESFRPPADLSEDDRKLLSNYNEGYIDRILHEVGLSDQRKYGNLSENGEEFVKYKYDGEARFLDTEIGRLLDHVRAKYPNTIIVFTADHGEELWDHGSIGHGKTVFEELTHVPLIVHQRGSTPRTIDAPVELIDILPTCSGMLELPLRQEWQGRNLAAALDELPVNRAIYSQTQMSIPGSNRDLETVIIDADKLILDRKSGTRTLYDLRRDPGERAGFQPANEDAAPLDSALGQHHATNDMHPQRRENRETVTVDPEQAEAIRNIGYGR